MARIVPLIEKGEGNCPSDSPDNCLFDSLLALPMIFGRDPLTQTFNTVSLSVCPIGLVAPFRPHD